MSPEYAAWLAGPVKEHLRDMDARHLNSGCDTCSKLVKDFFDEEHENFVGLLVEVVNRHLMRGAKDE